VASSPTPTSRFEDVGAAVGLSVSHISSVDKRYIVESMSGGAGLIDCDGDGRLDILTVNGSTVERYRAGGGDPMITLYHQEAAANALGMKFVDITAAAGLTRKGWGMGVSVTDYDNDGLPDIYVTGYGGNALYHNLGGCKFEDVTEKSGVAVGGFSTGSAWLDYDHSGRLSLFVSRYVHVDMNKLPELGSNERFCRYRGLLVQCGPWGMVGESDFLFRNRGDGTFEDVSKRAGVDDPNHYYGLGVVVGDYDNDGWPDIYVANDAGPNYLYRNKHDGTFEETGLSGGADLNGEGQEQGSMGVDMGDYENTGQQGVMVTNFVDQSDTLYRNLGAQGFADVSWKARIAQPSRPYVGWGTSFFDMDNDGWLDLLVVNGHVYPQVDSIAGEAHYKQGMLLFRNKHDGSFNDVTAAAGLATMPPQSRRGAAFGDVNNDGCLDVLVVNIGAPPSLLLNHCDPANHRVMFRLSGGKRGKLAIGARVTLKTRGGSRMREVRSGGSYLSQNDLRVHFGLGAETKIASVEVLWPSGLRETLKDLDADFLYDLKEGAGIQNKTALVTSAR
jgi:enediyne biosynthesis protein E4